MRNNRNRSTAIERECVSWLCEACDIGVIPTDLGRRIGDRRELPQIVIEPSSGQTEEAAALTQGKLRVVRSATNEDAFVVEVGCVTPNTSGARQDDVLRHQELRREFLGDNRPIDDTRCIDCTKDEEALTHRVVGTRVTDSLLKQSRTASARGRNNYVINIG